MQSAAAPLTWAGLCSCGGQSVFYIYASSVYMNDDLKNKFPFTENIINPTEAAAASLKNGVESGGVFHI